MRKTPTPKKSPPFISTWTALALLAVWLLSGCETPSKPLPREPVRSVQLPPLPSYARQPQTPLDCLPTCLDALMSERQSWLKSLTDATSLAEPASANTTAPEKN